MDPKNNNNKNSKGGRNLRGVLVLLAWALVLTIGFNYFAAYTGNAAHNSTSFEVDFSALADLVREDKIARVEFEDGKIYAVPIDGYVYTDESGKEPKTYTNSEKTKVILYTTHINSSSFYALLDEHHVAYTAPVQEQMSPILQFMISYILPTILMLGAFMLVMRLLSRSSGGIGGIGNVGKSNAKVYMEKQTGVTFKDVAGQDEAKESLVEIIDFLHNPQKYAAIGAKLPKGALLVGPPGTGKTLLAKAVAGEAKVPFFSISGSEFVEMFVGMGAARVRDLFKQAQEKAPCIVFIDEIDAIGKRRDNGQFGGNDEREQTLNQLLSEMDGFDGSKGVVILAATNRPESLDKALLRPGRFDRRIPVELPDLKGREAILKVHARNVRMADNIDYGTLARATAGASGAELANIINEGALRAVKMHRNVVEQEDLEESIETVIAGYQRKGAVISLAEKKVIAYHEIGHALVAAMQKHSAPVHKITIIPRTNGALGYTMQISENDSVLMTKEELFNKIVTMTGGRSAEEVVFGSITSGASNDIEQATKLARSMVTRLGMTEEFDMMATEVVANRYLGGDAALQCSETTAGKIDAKVLALIKEAHAKARTILQDNRNKLDVLAQYLLEKETITGEQFMALLQQEQAKENAEEKTPEE